MKLRQAILDKSRPGVSVLDYDREELTSLLREKIAAHGNVAEAYLFGSVASGKAGAWSDLDVVIIAETDMPFIERPRVFWDLLDLGIPLDILVYTPSEFSNLLAAKTGFWKEFSKNNIKLIH